MSRSIKTEEQRVLKSFIQDARFSGADENWLYGIMGEGGGGSRERGDSREIEGILERERGVLKR